MDVITPAWEVFSSLSSPQIKTLDGLTINSISAVDEVSAFKGKLIAFISVLKEVLEKLDKLYASTSMAAMKSNMEKNETASDPASAQTVTPSTSCSHVNSEKEITLELNSSIACIDVEMEDIDLSSSDVNSTNEAKSVSHPEIDPKLVQIKASKAEIERRISAFIERKQHEVDEMNKREFCSVFSIKQDGQLEDSCARTDAVFIPRAGCKSHVKVSRVVNVHGPQTVPGYHSNSQPTSQSLGAKPESADQSLAVEERLHNMEDHLNIYKDSSPSRDVVFRLKTLENRILYLESLSPEYFDNMAHSLKPKRQRFENSTYMTINPREATLQYQSLSVDEIDLKMKALRDKLLQNPDS